MTKEEWALFQRALEKIPRGADIPLSIGDKEVYTDKKIESLSPINKELVCTAQKATAEHAEQMVKAALAAKKVWAELPPENRIMKFRDLEQILYARRHEMCAAACYECGYIPMECSGGWAEMIDFMRFNPYYYYELQQLKLGEGVGETNAMSVPPATPGMWLML